MNNRIRAQRIAFLIVLGSVAAIAGCRTTEGFGEDLQKLGRKIEHKSEDVQHGY